MREDRKRNSRLDSTVGTFAYKQFEKYVSGYDAKRDLSADDLYRLVSMISFYARPSGLTLDLGCGTGQLLTHLAAENPVDQFAGIDVNRQMILKTKSRARKANTKNCELIIASGENLPFFMGRFKLVLLMQSLHHFGNIDAVACEVKEAIAQDGMLIVACCSHEQIRSSLDIVNFPGVLENEIERVPDTMTIKELFEKKGFRLKACVEFASSRRFASCNHLTDWIRSIPFSTYAILPENTFAKGLTIFKKRLKMKYGNAEIVYLFCETILIFQKN
jgi:SAM-dependent methyltransferase